MYRTDKVVEDLDLPSYLAKFKEEFQKYVQHLVVSWYLRNAKAEAFAQDRMPPNMMSFIADFAQNIEVIKRDGRRMFP